MPGSSSYYYFLLKGEDSSFRVYIGDMSVQKYNEEFKHWMKYYSLKNSGTKAEKIQRIKRYIKMLNYTNKETVL